MRETKKEKEKENKPQSESHGPTPAKTKSNQKRPPKKTWESVKCVCGWFAYCSFPAGKRAIISAGNDVNPNPSSSKFVKNSNKNLQTASS